MPNVVCWETDGTTFRVYSDGDLVFETPIADVSETPTQLLAKDPATGLPRWTGTAAVLADYARKEDIPLDTGDTGTVPPVDDPLPGDDPVRTVVATDKPLPPVVVVAPDPDNCAIMRCGAAHYLAEKLKEQYDLIRNFLLGMVALPAIPFIPVEGSVIPATALSEFLAVAIDWLIGKFAPIWVIRVLIRLKQALRFSPIHVDLSFEDLGDDGAHNLQRLAYPCLTCSDNTMDLTWPQLQAWEAAINADTFHFTEWQRHLLVYCIQFTPLSTYHSLAAEGAARTSDVCGEW